MRMGFDWDSTDVNILLFAKLAKPLMGTARIVINSIHMKGEVCNLLFSLFISFVIPKLNIYGLFPSFFWLISDYTPKET